MRAIEWLKVGADRVRRMLRSPNRSSESGELFGAAAVGGATRVAVVSHDAHMDGAPLLVLHVAQALRRKLNVEVTTILLGDGPLRKEFEEVGPVIDFTRPHWSAKPSASLVGVRKGRLKALRAAGYECALCNTTVSGQLLPILHEAGFRSLVLIHELPELIKKLGLVGTAAVVGSLADRVVFPAAFVRDRFTELAPVPEERTAVRPQGLFRPNPHRDARAQARARLRHLIGAAEGAPIVIGAGPADRRKGVDVFCQVASIVSRCVPDAVFVWMGDDDKDVARDCKAWLDAIRLAGRVHFLGLIRDADTYLSHIAGGDVFMMTSREDPFPSVVLDALAVGMPVVGFVGAGGFAELLARGAGVLVPYEDRSAMAKALMSLLLDGEHRRSMGKVGRSLIDREFQFLDYVYDLLRLAGVFRPKVSVVIPNYNYAQYLPARIASVTKQTYRPYEIVFLDDHSADDSLDVARRLLKDCVIPYRIMANERNAGCYAQWLAGIAQCGGDLVWIAEADDECEPTMLERLVPAFQDEQVVLAYCQSRRIDGEGKVIMPDYLDHSDAISATRWRHAYVRPGADEIRDTLAIKNTIPNASAVLMRKPSLNALKGRLVQHRNAGDWLTYAHVLERGSIAFCPEVLNSHRVHGRGLTQAGDAARHFAEIVAVQEYIRERHALADETLAKVEDMRQRTYRHLGLEAAFGPDYRVLPEVRAVLDPNIAMDVALEDAQ